MRDVVINRIRTAIVWSGAVAGLAAIGLSAGKPARSGQSREEALTASHLAAPGSISLTLDATREIGPISPAVYGMAQPTREHFKQLNLKLTRWGGNPATRYNWEKGNCWNAAADWEFRNGNYNNSAPADRLPSGTADKTIRSARAAGADMLLTIPTMGWVARNDNTSTASVGVPKEGGPPIKPGSEAISGYDPAANRQKVSQRSLPRKGRPFTDPPDMKDNVVYQDEWVYHLTRRFGKAGAGGVRYYAMDNEPDLWSSTHRDMRPVRPDYEEMLHQFLDYAVAVKEVDPSAKITGPVSWGWTGYFFSPRDQGRDNYATHADRKAHGDRPFLEWFLKQVAAHDKKTGRRSLDYLDIHFYPQGTGVYGGQTDASTNALRLRSTRALWDPDYADESWIQTPVQLIPRMRQWIHDGYPGTKLALTEWNWGADNTLNGGLAVAEVLGVLGREQVDIACYWTAPGTGTPGFYAYKMFRNADGAGHGFGDTAVSAASNEPHQVSCYGSVEKRTGRPVALIINKSLQNLDGVNLTLTSKRPITQGEVFRYSGADLKAIQTEPGVTFRNGRAVLKLPASSITLIRAK